MKESEVGSRKSKARHPFCGLEQTVSTSLPTHKTIKPAVHDQRTTTDGRRWPLGGEGGSPPQPTDHPDHGPTLRPEPDTGKQRTTADGRRWPLGGEGGSPPQPKRSEAKHGEAI